MFASRGGRWDRARHEFVFEQGANSAMSDLSFHGVVFVKVGKFVCADQSGAFEVFIIRTTERYIHVVQGSILSIRSPLN